MGDITIEKDIQSDFELIHQFNMPCVNQFDDGSYRISVDKYSFKKAPRGSINWEYFEIDKNGIILEAPRGYTKKYKGSKIIDIDEWVAKYKK